MSRLSKFFYAGAMALGALIALPQLASAQDGWGWASPGPGPRGSYCAYGECTGGSLGNRTVNRNQLEQMQNERVSPRVRRHYNRDRDREVWNGDHRDNRGWRGHHRDRYYRDRSSAYVDLYVPSYRYREPVYVEPRYVPRRTIRMSAAHVDWCYDRYRSYRASDNTFNPGKKRPRRQCYSPYS